MRCLSLLPVGLAQAYAIAWSRRPASEEGIFTGISGGASLGVAMQVAERAPAGSVICCMRGSPFALHPGLPDGGIGVGAHEGVVHELDALAPS